MTKKILASLILSIFLAATVQAAIGIPENLQPKNVPLKGLNKTVTQQVAENGQDGAVTGANIILQYMANILLFFAAPLAVLFLARAAADYAFSMGEDAKLESAKREFTWSLLGLLLVMFSYILVRVFIEPLPLLQDATDAALPKQIEQGAEAICKEKYGMSCEDYAKLPEDKKPAAKTTAEEEALCKKIYKMSCAEYAKQDTKEAKEASNNAAKNKAIDDKAAEAQKIENKCFVDYGVSCAEAAKIDAKGAKELEAMKEQLKKDEEALKKAAEEDKAKELECQKKYKMSCAEWDATPAKYEEYKPSDDGFGSPLSGKTSF